MRFRIDNVPSDTTEHDIRQLFAGYGSILSVTLLPGPLHSKQLGSGVIELENTAAKEGRVFPERCLFRGTVVHITQDRGAAESRTSAEPMAPDGPDTPLPHRPDNRSKNVLHVISIEEVIDSVTGRPNGWCRYSIRSLAGAITGLRHGSVAEVTLHAEEAAEAFNLRNMLGQRRPPTWSSRHKK